MNIKYLYTTSLCTSSSIRWLNQQFHNLFSKNRCFVLSISILGLSPLGIFCFLVIEHLWYFCIISFVMNASLTLENWVSVSSLSADLLFFIQLCIPQCIILSFLGFDIKFQLINENHCYCWLYNIYKQTLLPTVDQHSSSPFTPISSCFEVL